ncbi:MAG TPA: GNAT family N-acetyltransferase [Sporichthyaceae bacterium]|nr:GNAT family N-acetyltransferase [Sporichthyaceae bacterium]
MLHTRLSREQGAPALTAAAIECVDRGEHTLSVRVLGLGDLAAATRIAQRDPIANVFVLSRLEVMSRGGARACGELWGHQIGGELRGLCFLGANVVPVEADEAALTAFGERAARLPRRCSSIVGRSDQVMRLWDRLEPSWGPAREVRPRQPLLVLDRGAAQVRPDPLVRRAEPDDLAALLPACIAMFTEEVGVSPLNLDGGAMYRARVRELVAAGRAFVRVEDGEVIFKAEVGTAINEVCQIQGVWVNPRLRGRGLAAAGMAAVAELAWRHVAPVVSLYVNDYNLAARAVYRRVGFRQVGTFGSILF